jgi:hypothetical protein
LSQDPSTGLLVQNPANTHSTTTFTADNDEQAGAMECWMVRCETAADQAYDNAAAITNVFNGTKLARNHSYRIVKIETVLRVLRTGGSADHDIKVETGDGAGTESFASLVATVDIDSDTLNLPTNRTLVAAECILLTGETLRVQFEVSGSTTTGTGEVEVYIYAIPVVA